MKIDIQSKRHWFNSSEMEENYTKKGQQLDKKGVGGGKLYPYLHLHFLGVLIFLMNNLFFVYICI